MALLASKSVQELITHIEYLLRHHDCVILPGFGAFLKSHREAEYSGSTLIPPTYDICFNSAVSNDDALLANSFARRLKISFEESRVRLAEAIEALRGALYENGELTVGRMGSLVIGDENNISFRPLRNSIEIMRALGYEVLTLNTNSGGSQNGSIDSTHDSKSNFNVQRNYYIPVNKIFAKVAASLILLMTVGISFWLSSDSVQSPKQYASVVPSAAVEKASVTSATIPEFLLAVPQQERKHENIGVEDAYYLVVGTFKTTEEAQNFINSRSGKSLLSIESGRNVKVVFAGAETSQELLSVMNSPEFRSDFPSAWIWKKK